MIRPDHVGTADTTPYLVQVGSATGFAISTRRFLTAAHVCPAGVDCSFSDVRAFVEGKARKTRARCAVHERYRFAVSSDFDFAKCDIEGQWEFEEVLGLCAEYQPPAPVRANEVLTGFGFGCRNGGTLTARLDNPSAGWLRVTRVESGRIGLIAERGARACAGDSGGPLLRGAHSLRGAGSCVVGVIHSGVTRVGSCHAGDGGGANEITSEIAAWARL